MREARHREFLLRDYRIPVLKELVWYVDDKQDEYPKLDTIDVREVVYVGHTWPSPDEVADAIDEYQAKFARPPDRVVLPRLHGAKFRGVEVMA